MGILHMHPTDGMPAVARILSQFERAQLAGFIEVAISLLDASDGDPDLELAGDELDGNGAEDDFMEHNAGWLPAAGCPVSDPGGDHLDEGEADPGILKPIYGTDQSKGPINEVTAVREWKRAQLDTRDRGNSPTSYQIGGFQFRRLP